MHFKLGLISTLAATASASIVGSNYHQGQGLVLANEYVERNLNEICFSKHPVNICDEDYVVKTSKGVKVNFHCLNKNSDLAKQWINQVNQNQVIPEIKNKPTDVQARVEMPTNCIKRNQLTVQEQYKRSQEQLHGQRVELIDNETDYQDESEWKTYERYSNEEEYNQYRKNYSQQEKDWQNYDIVSQYPYVGQQKSLHHMVNLNENNYHQLSEQLQQLVSNQQISKHLLPEVQTVLPSYFSQVARQLYNVIQKNKHHAHQNVYENNYNHNYKNQQEIASQLNEITENYETYKKQLQRIYSFVVKEVVVLSQTYTGRLPHTSYLVHKTWENIQKQMTKNQIQHVEQMLEYVQDKLQMDPTETELSDLLVYTELRSVHKATRRNLLRIVLTGLNMFKNNFN